MPRSRKPARRKATQRKAKGALPNHEVVESLLDEMEDGNEYGCIVAKVPNPSANIADLLVEGLAEIQQKRGRPCLAYIGNVVRGGEGCQIEQQDDLPFAEMIAKVPADEHSVDVLLATPVETASR